MAMSLKSDSYSRERKIGSHKKTTDSVGKFSNKLITDITHQKRWMKKVNGKKGSKSRHYPTASNIYDYI
jgi:hypothetical protein